ncbi:MAG: helix-turn-helix transcriptional regulator [Deltaproteobacteria bacterium]|jgi:transcriptional regulator with XRE-family HTH domain|nr:helix-turn-helix transcriptional regulator [Deltaproteobacteria bacterium]MCK4603418.1 helix-turn-helix transcriptional regulator [Deltaproteobacteria bacterium]
MRTPIQDIINLLKNIEYKKIYGSESAKTSLAITLSRARRNLNMTQKKFAEKLGKSQPYIAKLESGDANPTIGAIGSMLAVVGLSLEIDTKALIPCISSLQQDQYVTRPKAPYVLSAQDDKAIEKIDHQLIMCSSSSSVRATTETVVA